LSELLEVDVVDDVRAAGAAGAAGAAFWDGMVGGKGEDGCLPDWIGLDWIGDGYLGRWVSWLGAAPVGLAVRWMQLVVRDLALGEMFRGRGASLCERRVDTYGLGTICSSRNSCNSEVRSTPGTGTSLIRYLSYIVRYLPCT
jgi:hypothetical protein